MTFRFEGVMTMTMEQSMIISGIIHKVTKIAMKQNTVLHSKNTPSNNNQQKLNTKLRATV